MSAGSTAAMSRQVPGKSPAIGRHISRRCPGSGPEYPRGSRGIATAWPRVVHGRDQSVPVNYPRPRPVHGVDADRPGNLHDTAEAVPFDGRSRARESPRLARADRSP